MIYQVERIAFPYDTVYAVAAINKDGTYTVYANTLCTEEQQQKAVKYLVDEINGKNCTEANA